MKTFRFASLCLALGIVLGSVVPVLGTISIPHTFTPFTTISSTQMNANFTQLGTNALHRGGDTITGAILVNSGVTIDGADISAYLAGGKLIATSTAADSLDVAGGITAGTGNVAIIGTTGKIPALTSTYFTSLDASTLTGILPAPGSDGNVLTSDGAGAWVSEPSLSSFAGAQASIPSGFSTTSATPVMSGFGSSCTITPTRNGSVTFMFAGDATTTTLTGNSMSWRITYGTGVAPIAGAAVTGTAIGATPQHITSTANYFVPFALNYRVTGLTVDTAYWFDLRFNSDGAATSAMARVSC